MTREWRTFKGPETEDITRLEEEERRLDLQTTFNMAQKWSRLYGTSLIVMDIEDGGDPEDPLELDFIGEGDLNHIKAVDCNRFDTAQITITYDPLDPNYGLPEHYRFTGSGTRVHHSRVLRFDAIKLPFDEFLRNRYLSDSVLARLYTALVNFNTVTDAAASMVYNCNIDIIKVENLLNLVQTQEGMNLVTKRFALADMLKSFNNTLLLDSKEQHEIKTNTFTSLPELMDRYGMFLTGGSDIPAVRLMGTSAKGLNATGEGDLDNYYDKLKSNQIVDFKPKLEYFDKIMARSLGFDSEQDLSFEFNPLYQMDPSEIAEIELKNAQRDQIYLGENIIDEVTTAKQLMQKGVYSNISEKTIAEMEKLIGSINNLASNSNET